MENEGQLPRSIFRRLAFAAIYIFLSLIFIFIAGEGISRAFGYKPYSPDFKNTRVISGGAFFKSDTALGYVTRPGHFKIMVYPNRVFNVTQTPFQGRTTFSLYLGDSVRSRLDSTLSMSWKNVARLQYPQSEPNQIWICGCSITHGWLLNDRQTFPWLIQKKFPANGIVNFGVSGYSTLQSLGYLKRMLNSPSRPQTVVLAYASFHDQRNTCNRAWLKSITTQSIVDSFNYPYARFDKHDSLTYGMLPIKYHGLPFIRRFAFMNLLDNGYNIWQEKKLRSHDVSIQLIEQFNSLCKQEHFKFILAGIANDQTTLQTLKHFADEGVAAVDISIDLTNPHLTFLPFDPHPNAKGDSIMAEKLATYLNSTLPSDSNSKVN